MDEIRRQPHLGSVFTSDMAVLYWPIRGIARRRQFVERSWVETGLQLKVSWMSKFWFAN